MKKTNYQIACKNQDGTYSLLLLDHENEKYCITKRDYKPFGSIVSEAGFAECIDKTDYFNCCYSYAETDYLEETPKIGVKALWDAVLTRRTSVSKIRGKFDVDLETATAAIEWMERMGYITPEQNGERLVLLKRNDFGVYVIQY